MGDEGVFDLLLRFYDVGSPVGAQIGPKQKSILRTIFFPVFLVPLGDAMASIVVVIL